MLTGKQEQRAIRPRTGYGERLRFSHSIVPPVVEILSALRRVYVNGGAVYARFAVSGSRDFEWFATRNRWDEIAFCARLLTHPDVRRKVPDLTRDAKFDEEVAFEWGSPLTLDGEFARALVFGGAYKFDGTAKMAKDWVPVFARRCSVNAILTLRCFGAGRLGRHGFMTFLG